MIRSLIIILPGVFCTATPAAAQQSSREQPQEHQHGARGHNDIEDVQAVLRMIAVNQVRHRAQHGRYAASLGELGLGTPRTVVVRITAAGGEGFAAVSASATEECAYFAGSVRPPRNYVSRPNELVCRAISARAP